MITTDGCGVRRGVVFVERWKHLGLFMKGKDWSSEMKRDSLTYKFSGGLDRGRREGTGWGRDWKQNTGRQTRLVKKAYLSFIEIAIKKRIDRQINSGTRIISF